MTVPLVLVTCRQMQVELHHHRDRIEAMGYEYWRPISAGASSSPPLNFSSTVQTW